MAMRSKEILKALGAGQAIEAVCAKYGLTREEFDRWWQDELRSRLPKLDGNGSASVTASVRLVRDEWGIPHVFAERERDLFFGFGYAVAQDRLFQLDYLRRRARGELSEVLGRDGLELDRMARTVGLPTFVDAEWDALPGDCRDRITAYSEGVNAYIAECGDRLPIEFDLLDYRPAPWRPGDCLAIAGEFRWYLTGRFPIIALPELAKRVLGDGALYREFCLCEADDEPILPPGAYRPATRSGQIVGAAANDPQEGHGSNNWVISGERSDTGHPRLASDPHIAFAAVSCWHEVHLSGGDFHVAGMNYVGIPAVMFGRTERVAWGITNNICSQRDLYQERTSPEHPGCFQFDGKWEPAKERVEEIRVRDAEPVRLVVRSSRHGPIVDDVLPAPVRQTGPVSLRWLGSQPCGWIAALQNMDRSKSCAELKAALEPWLVPTFSVVFADVEGAIGYHAAGRIPLRSKYERGYRPGWDPEHVWTGLIPFAEMPHWDNPSRGWIATANHRVAADDFPYPLSGCWSNGWRGVRLRQIFESQPTFTAADFRRIHQDSLSLRAVACLPPLLDVLRSRARTRSASAERRIDQAIAALAAWDCRMEPDRVGGTIFDAFFHAWCRAVAERRFSGEAAALVAGAIPGVSSRLLSADPHGWFASDRAPGRVAAIVDTFANAVETLAQRFGENLLDWGWGRVHKLQQWHFLSTRGELGKLLDRGGIAVNGDMVTVCNSGRDAIGEAPSGAGYRMIADLDPQQPPLLWAIEAGSESGHPGSPHYDDQLHDWVTGQYHAVSLTRNPADLAAPAERVRELRPNGSVR